MDLSWAKKLVLPALILILVGGVIFMVATHDSRLPNCPGHWHTTFAVYEDGQQVSFAQPPYMLDSEGGVLPFSMHIHRGSPQQLHFEPTPDADCRSVRSTFGLLDVELNKANIKFDGEHSISGSFGAASNQTIRVFMDSFDYSGDFVPASYGAYEFNRTEVSYAKFRGMGQLPHLTKVLIVIGPAEESQLDSWWMALPDPQT